MQSNDMKEFLTALVLILGLALAFLSAETKAPIPGLAKSHQEISRK